MRDADILDRERIDYLLARVNDELAADNAHADIYVVGGAAMLVAYGGALATRDIDCAVRKGRDQLFLASKAVARQEDLSDYWLNDAVSWQYLPDAPDHGERTFVEHSHLRVSVASPERMLAMALSAGREDHLDNVWRLADLLERKTIPEIMQVYRRTFGDRELDEDYSHSLWTAFRQRHGERR